MVFHTLFAELKGNNNQYLTAAYPCVKAPRRFSRSLAFKVKRAMLRWYHFRGGNVKMSICNKRNVHQNDSGSSNTNIESLKTEVQKIKKKAVTLLQWQDMPKHLQFNPYILTGYRPLLTTWGCLNSIFYMHNETINIITHGMVSVNIFLFWVV